MKPRVVSRTRDLVPRVRGLLEITAGLTLDPDDPARLYVVTERDDATLPSDLLVVSLDV